MFWNNECPAKSNAEMCVCIENSLKTTYLTNIFFLRAVWMTKRTSNMQKHDHSERPALKIKPKTTTVLHLCSP